MKNITKITIYLLSILCFISCNVEQTQDTKMPEVDVDVSAGQLPAFEVDWAEVNVGTRTKKVSVPKVVVVMEEMEVDIPYVDVDMPNETGKEERTIQVEAEIKGEMQKLQIQEVHASNKRLYVISKLESTGKKIDKKERVRISDRLVLNAPDLDIKHYIVGNRPTGDFNRQYSYIDSKSAIKEKLKNATRIL